MRVEDLHHDEILELDPDAGVIRFAGQRALLLDAFAMGILRQYLVENFGETAARAVLTQFGFAHGWRMAEAMGREFKWESQEHWRRAGPRIHTLGGLFRTEPDRDDPLSKHGMTLLSSYEAEQHILHIGPSEQPVCWTICGLTSGYLSRVTGEEIVVLEDRCVGAGHAACHLLGRRRGEWGPERADELMFFDSARLAECLDVSLAAVTATLKEAEKTLRTRRRSISRIVSDGSTAPPGIVAVSSHSRRAVDLARRVAKVDATVLITGDSGVGKERFARLIHDDSARAGGPFIAVNCGAISETLLESELFGHKRGAFTGASSDRLGLFEAAHHGTLLLDEIGEISPGLQVKLLRVLEEREVRRVGENRARAVDVRILAATNRDLVHGITDGAFRQDLYYRLKVVELHIPSLAERREDILPLARVLLAEAATRMKRDVSSLTPRAADQLLRYDWPGNVRELKNAMERGVALAAGPRVEFDDLPEEVRQAFPKPVPSSAAAQTLKEVEKEYILGVLAMNGGNQARTAEQLQIGSATLYRKLKKYAANGPPEDRPD